jgi:lipoprotein-releasing system ATP-binding protein
MSGNPEKRGREGYALELRGVHKRFDAPGGERSSAASDAGLHVLHGIDLELERGATLALVGASGAGKSTLLHIAGLLERPTSGEVWVTGRAGWSLSAVERAALRNRAIGFVFQFYHLLPELDAEENVLLPAMIAHSRGAFGGRASELRARARELLSEFGLDQRRRHRPAQLSGGERQRVALARALFQHPPLLIADEPTGNLDSATGERVLELLFAAQRKQGFALLLVTHDERLAARCARRVRMRDGRIESELAPRVPGTP